MNKYKKKELILIENLKKKFFMYYMCNYIYIFFFIYLVYIYIVVCSLFVSVWNFWFVVFLSLEFYGVFVILNLDLILVFWDVGILVEVVEGFLIKLIKNFFYFVILIYLKMIIFFIKN